MSHIALLAFIIGCVTITINVLMLCLAGTRTTNTSRDRWFR